jgi:hypothetical protein
MNRSRAALSAVPFLVLNRKNALFFRHVICGTGCCPAVCLLGCLRTCCRQSNFDSGPEERAQSVVVNRGVGLLGFRRGVALLAVKAFLVIRLPVLIGLASFELYGFPANAADWEPWFRGDGGVRDVGQEVVSRRESDCTRDRRPGTRRRKDV